MASLKHTLKNNPFFWRYFLNRKGSFQFLMHPSKISNPVVVKMLDNLRRNGVAIGNAEDIIGKDLYNELYENAFRLRYADTAQDSDKEYARFYLERNYDSNSIWAKVSEHKNIVDIAKGYFRMEDPRLVYYDLWENLPVNEAPKDAQLWHRDRDDLQILKVFIYFTDVDEQTGAFVYAPGTQALGNVKSEPSYFLENGKQKRSYDADMDKVVPSDKWIMGKGKKGTIVFADTHGYHKGGFVKNNFRFLFTCMYLSRYSGRIRFDNVRY
jgi:Phytanoyl-CoA dioxygenase (PhyH)